MDYDLWLFFDEPDRYAYCSSSLHGIPFDGIDYCEDGKYGGMKGIIGKKKQIFDVKNEQGYIAEMISWVAESAALNPVGLLSEHITYETIDQDHVKATINMYGSSGSGIFTFDKNGAITEFYSDERQVEKIDGVMTPVGWRCEYMDYVQQEGIKRIQKINCVKVFPEKEVIYFASDHFKIEILLILCTYNIFAMVQAVLRSPLLYILHLNLQQHLFFPAFGAKMLYEKGIPLCTNTTSY